MSILLQTVFVTALTVLVGGFLLEYIIDGVYNDDFSEVFIGVLKFFHVKEEVAINLYWRVLGDNKNFFMILGFLGLFALFFYIALSKMMKYLEQVEDGIENIVSESSDPIHLITELQPIEKKLNSIKYTLERQEREMQEAERKKNELVVFLAHDLKTPLTSIVAYLTMLESHPEMPVEERCKYTKISLEKAMRLGELIGEFFEITRFNAQDIILEKTELNLSRMLEQIADELYGVLQGRDLVCEVDFDEDIIVKADPDKMARVFDNLLRNAISYCRQGTVIRIWLSQDEKDARIVFANEGERIPEEKLSHIFEKFFRADESRSSQTGGAGLGLAIAKEIVELHGGTIHAKSDDRETRFTVTLPIHGKEDESEIHTHGGRSLRS
ncbi:sensor histidine kinase [Sellimonas caecigallum]|uniref:sensor histidine kinase n=1 Tax=Sellimonas caecigallum TaxID=2592333 RepID=UPI001FE7EA16|nr:HAMP domain-containing sensor histidine kinase [Sellimonas caecigallum]